MGTAKIIMSSLVNIVYSVNCIIFVYSVLVRRLVAAKQKNTETKIFFKTKIK